MVEISMIRSKAHNAQVNYAPAGFDVFLKTEKQKKNPNK